MILFLIISLAIISLSMTVFTVFFDHAVLVRNGTIYHVDVPCRVVALTFDDGPSPKWTPKILNALKEAKIKATFFMVGKHVKKYPEIARQVAEQGHDIQNHSCNHNVLIYYTMDELETEIRDTEKAIKDASGQTTRYFRPPKAWLTNKEKKKIEEMGYKTVLWTLNSKDWVNFDDKFIIKFMLRKIKPGDILLFHDSGGVFACEGGDRNETVEAIPKLVNKLKQLGYSFVTVNELLNLRNNGA